MKSRGSYVDKLYIVALKVNIFLEYTESKYSLRYI